MELTQEQLDTKIAEAVTAASNGKFDQAGVDRIVQDRLAREKTKYADYDELKKFQTDHKKAAEQQNQADLEKQKKYEEAKQGFEKKISEQGSVIQTQTDTIRDMRISQLLIAEITANNGYVEETLALLKGQAVVDDAGNVTIKGKDANNLDANLSVADGVKNFLKARPHLVKATATPGAGTPSGGAGGGGSGDGDDLNALNLQLASAQLASDYKRVNELKQKIREHFTAKKINRSAA